MIFNFQTGTVTFLEDDQKYFEKRLHNLKKYLGNEAGDDDTVKTNIKIEKNKHKSGDRFEATVNMITPNNGNFYAKVSEDNIKKCADKLHDVLQKQITKFHGKHKN